MLWANGLLNCSLNLGYCVLPIIVNSNVIVMGNSSGLEGTMITYYCWQSRDDPPVKAMVAVCTRDGYWSPNPDELECLMNSVESYHVTINSWTDDSDIPLRTLSEGIV